MLEIKNLRKEYRDLVAVRGLSFTLQPGDIFGFIGSNGAGKTTTIRMLATLLEPSSGTALLNGVDINKNPMAIRRMMGYMPDFFGLYDDVKVWEYLDFFATIYEIPPRERPDVIANVLELTDLSVKRDSFVQSLSRGMQQRLCLARCLVHDPALLLLDEPASGLDPRARAELKELILELGRMGKIVIVSSHILPELSGFCNTVGIIEKGELKAFGAVDEVVRALRPHRQIKVRLLRPDPDAFVRLQRQSAVESLRTISELEMSFVFTGSDEDQVELLAELVQAQHLIMSFQEDFGNLEDVFMQLTTGAVQ